MPLIQTDYNSWTAQVVSATSTTLTIKPQVVTLNGGAMLVPWNTNASLLIANGTAIAETKTPTVISYSTVPGAVVLTFSSLSYTHGSGDTVQSGTAGLQEMLNAQSGAPNPAQSNIVVSKLSVAAQGTTRLADEELTLGYVGSTAVTGSVAAERGNTTVGATTNITSGFLYGDQGKLTVQGTLSGTGWYAAVLGQVDTSSATAVHSAGRLSCLWADFGATSIMATDANASLLLLTNTTGCLINAVETVAANASYYADITDLAGGGAHFVVSKGGATLQTNALKVLINGTPMFIPLYA